MASTRSTLHLVFLALALAAVVGGCQKQQNEATGKKQDQGDPTELADFGGERIWQGVLPCADCLGIDTRLVLRQDGADRHYVLEETYLGAAEPNRFERKGRWTEMHDGREQASATIYVLDPDRAPRRFRLHPDGGVELLTGGAGAAPAPEFRLQRL